jgi:hypothetical protein
MSVQKTLFRTCVRMLTVLTMLTMIYLFENTFSDREQGGPERLVSTEAVLSFAAVRRGDPLTWHSAGSS